MNPATSAGKIFSVAFALIGIPLMFITAADIGKFLSEMVILIFRKWHQFANFISKRFCSRLHEKIFGAKSKTPPVPPDDQRSTSEGHSLITEEIEETEGLWFPIGAYVGLVSAYCALGAFLYRNWEPWNFIHAFQFSFNQVVTIGLGNVNIKDGIYLVLAVAYIIVGKMNANLTFLL